MASPILVRPVTKGQIANGVGNAMTTKVEALRIKPNAASHRDTGAIRYERINRGKTPQIAATPTA